jgi:hypothetical protein
MGRRLRLHGRRFRTGEWLRDPDRIPLILRALERCWREQPDSRLGQLLSNLTRDQESLFNVEDGELLRRLGTETNDERQYVEHEPASRRRGWRQAFRRGPEPGES